VNHTILLVRGSALHNEIRAGHVVKLACFNQDVKALIPSLKTHSKFLTYSILGRQSQLRDLVRSAGNTAGVLDIKRVQAFKIWLPDVNEQRAIATALADVDALIAGLVKLIAKKRDLKQSATQQLLTGQTRLPVLSGKWAVKRLGDHCAILKNGVNSRAKFSLLDVCKERSDKRWMSWLIWLRATRSLPVRARVPWKLMALPTSKASKFVFVWPKPMPTICGPKC
jgi:restriction endonuclease S subunit